VTAEIRFDGKAAIVTGSGAGLGRTCAPELAKRGAMVVVNDLGANLDVSGKSASVADTVVDGIQRAGVRAVANCDSVATAAGGESMVKTALDAFGRIDIVRDKPLVRMTEEECNETAKIFNRMDGWYSRTAVMCTKGVVLGDGKRAKTAEETCENWQKINGLESPRTLGSIIESFGNVSPLSK